VSGDANPIDEKGQTWVVTKQRTLVSRRKYSLHELLALQGDEPLLIDKA
jgi:hypothetical protein